MESSARIGGKIWIFAVLAGALLAGLWLRTDWAALSHGRLPDNDDMMRLAQVRDWIGGQRFRDLVQHRLGTGNSGSMHWSRIGDFGIAGWMLILRPLLGQMRGDIWAAILWPATLFIVYLAMSARLAARLCGRDHAAIALLVAAFAFPATAMFAPGRIDHHGLQIVLIVMLVEAVLRPPDWRGGAWAGGLIAASLAIGLETAPQCAVAMAVLFVLWVRDGTGERARAAAFACALGVMTLLWLMVARPEIWPAGLCDGFTPASSAAVFIASAFWLSLAILTPWLKDRRVRLAAGALLGIAGLAFAYRTSSVCLTGPYGAVDPLLRRLWIDRIEEARGLFARETPGVAIAFGGLPIAAMLASAAFLWREKTQGWAILLAFLAMGVSVTLFQVRGAAVAAALAAPAMAHLVIIGRRKAGRPYGTAILASAWLASGGLFYAIAGHVADGADSPGRHAGGAGCTDAATLEQIGALPRGTMIAPVDAGAYIIGLTPHRVLAASYHRNNTGNRAAYDFWLSPPDRARDVAERWHADYVLACPDAFGGIDLSREGPGGMAILLDRGEPPAWLVPIALTGSRGRLYRVLRSEAAHR